MWELLAESTNLTKEDIVSRMQEIDLRDGKPESAVTELNDRLDVETAEQIPRNLKKDRVLWVLERATLLQALGEYELSARDMMAVDQRLLWLDLDGEKSADLAKYLYSASATPYRAPTYERMLLNTLNMINFLALGDNQKAKVEARPERIREIAGVAHVGRPHQRARGACGLGGRRRWRRAS